MVYALIDNSRIVYIGHTHNLRERLYQHKKDKAFDSYLIIDETGDKAIESICIHHLIPYYNTRKSIKYLFNEARN